MESGSGKRHRLEKLSNSSPYLIVALPVDRQGGRLLPVGCHLLLLGLPGTFFIVRSDEVVIAAFVIVVICQ